MLRAGRQADRLTCFANGAEIIGKVSVLLFPRLNSAANNAEAFRRGGWVMRRVLNISAALIAAVLVSGGAAFAAEDPPIATATSAQPPLTSIPGVAMPDPTADQIDAWLKADGSSVRRPDPNGAESLAPVPRAIHGEVGATVSNRGYSAYGVAAMPIGEASELDVAVAGGHVSYPHGGSANPKSIAVGLYLDGRDVNNWLSHRGCGATHWGVALKDDPQVQADGSCKKKDAETAADKPSGHRRHGRGDGSSSGAQGQASDQAGASAPLAQVPAPAP